MAAPLMTNVSTTAAGTSTERPPPPVLGSTSLLGIVFLMTPASGDVVLPAVVLPAVVLPAVVLPAVVLVPVVAVVGPMSPPQASTAIWKVASSGSISKK